MQTTGHVDQPSPAAMRQATRDWAGIARAEAVAQRQRASQAVRQSAALIGAARGTGRRASPGANLGDADLTPGEAVLLTGAPLEQIWVAYAALGGDRTPQQIVEYLNGRTALPEIEINIFGHVLNEYLMDQGLPPLAPG